MLAVLGAGFFFAREAQRDVHAMLLRVLIDRLRIFHAEHVVPAVQHEVGALHLAEHAFQLERLDLLQDLGPVPGADHPLHQIRERVLLAAIGEALVHVPDRTMGDAGGEAMLLRAGARGVVAAEA